VIFHRNQVLSFVVIKYTIRTVRVSIFRCVSRGRRLVRLSYGEYCSGYNPLPHCQSLEFVINQHSHSLHSPRVHCRLTVLWCHSFKCLHYSHPLSSLLFLVSQPTHFHRHHANEGRLYHVYPGGAIPVLVCSGSPSLHLLCGALQTPRMVA
jgi:hypothetical protein